MSTSKPAPSDSRGGLFIDSGDGRGPIHTDDLTDAERATHGLAPRAASAPTSPEIAPELPTDSPTEDVTDGR